MLDFTDAVMMIEMRKVTGMTQAEFAAKLGIEERALIMIEKSERPVSRTISAKAHSLYDEAVRRKEGLPD